MSPFVETFAPDSVGWCGRKTKTPIPLTRRTQIKFDWMSECIGRDEILSQLRMAYDVVATPSDDGRHTPQFRIMLGMTGVGKTRIGQEHYRWLVRARDTDVTPLGYWPDTILSAQSDGVNPVFDLGEDRPWTDIPFLWWGLKFERGNQPGDALSSGIKRLPVHTAAAMAKRLSKRQRLENAKRLIGYGFDFLPVIKEIKTGFELLKDGWDVLAGRSKRQRAETESRQNIAIQEHRERVKLTDAAIEMLRQFMDRSDRKTSRIPVILFLDDTHWIDQVSMQFVSRLWSRASDEGWPLLILATHCASEWRVDELNLRHEQSIWNEQSVSTAIEPQNFVELFNQKKLNDGTMVLDVLGVEAEAISRMVRAALPGITEEQVNLLLEKARAEDIDEAGQVQHRCNPRMIRAMIEVFYQKKRDFFVAGDPEAALSDAACRWVRNEVDRLDLHKVIRTLFESFEEDVQLALGWSSIQGRRFIVDVTQEVAKRLSGPEPDAARAHLRRSENPYLWVERIPQSMSDLSRFNLLSFRQRVFQEVAADNFTLLDENRTTVDKAVSDVLSEWLKSGRLDPPAFGDRENDHGLSREEVRDLLVMAAHRFDSVETPVPLDEDRWGRAGRHADVHLCGLAVARLTSLNVDDGLWEQAEIAAGKFVDVLPKGCSRDIVDFTQQLDVLDVLYQMRKFERAWELADALARDSERCLLRDAEPGEVSQLAAALQRRGDCELATGRRAKAKETFRQMVHTLEQHRSHLEGPFAAHCVHVALVKLGDVEIANGNRSAAMLEFKKGLDVVCRSIEQYGETQYAFDDLSFSLERVGDVELAEGNRSAALKLYEESLSIAEHLVEQHGEHPNSLRGLGVALIKIGDVQLVQGNNAAAMKLFGKGLETRRRVLEAFGESPLYLRDVSVALQRLGNAQLLEGQVAPATSSYQESLDISRRITKRFGEYPDSLRNITIGHQKLGDIESLEGRYGKARTIFSRCSAQFRSILDRFGESSQALRDYSESLQKEGDVEFALENAHAAMRLYEKSLTIFRRILNLFGESPQSLSDIVATQIKMSGGNSELASGFLVEAKRLSDLLYERGWLTAQQRAWPELLARMMADLENGE